MRTLRERTAGAVIVQPSLPPFPSSATWLPAVRRTVPSPSWSSHASGRCESCGRDEDDLVEVHRVYVTPEPGTPRQGRGRRRGSSAGASCAGATTRTSPSAPPIPSSDPASANSGSIAGAMARVRTSIPGRPARAPGRLRAARRVVGDWVRRRRGRRALRSSAERSTSRSHPGAVVVLDGDVCSGPWSWWWSGSC